MAQSSLESDQDELINRLAEFSDYRARTSFLRQHDQLWDAAVVDRLYARVVRLARTDVQRADRLAQAATWVAEKLGDDVCRAQSLRATGHICQIRRRYHEALERYAAARTLFQTLGRDVDVARTLNGAIQSLICLGRYEEALASAHEARAIFDRHRNVLGLARLDCNVGNILHRQDRFDEALTCYRRAHEQLATNGEPQDLAAVLSNIAVTYISLNDFQQALETYQEARTHCERHDMPLLVLRADYNIAYLYYLRGEYMRALELYRAAQQQCEVLGDLYHSALCDLARSEIYLELNMSEEGGELADRALARFDELGMTYEAAKAVTNLALVTSRRGDIGRAGELFDRARQLFTREGNQVWLGLLDFYQALVLYRSGQYGRSRTFCENALALFAGASIPGRTALCELLLARLELQAGHLQAAEQACSSAFQRVAPSESPILMYQAHSVLGFVREAEGERELAYAAFQQAEGQLEHLRSHLQGEDLKVAFLEDKGSVYESLVTTCLALGPERERQEAAFGYIEKAKSRSLADLIAFRAVTLMPQVADEATEEVRRIRQELHWFYRQVELEEVRGDKRSTRRIEGLRRRARALEKQLSRSLGELRRSDDEFAVLQSGATCGLDEIRSSLESDMILLEYYQARDRIYVCVLGRDHLDVVPLAAAPHVRNLLRLLQFQFSKFRLGPDYVGAFGEQLKTATETHLRELHTALIAPIRDRLTAGHLLVVPHAVLHSVPFHALFDGERFVIDEFTMSYAPSASVYRQCRMKQTRSTGGALIIGVPDPSTPFIIDEVQAVASTLRDPKVLLGGEATVDQLQKHGVASRFVHIATHGLFRRDNPMFSSIRLGDGPLSVYDLYQLRLSAELVTLSGCSTGLSEVVGGDELLGLVRGLLYAGASAVLLTLWDVNDKSTADFMKAFYGHLQKGLSKAEATREGMRELRDRYPHPFYWAPFTLIGNGGGP